MSQILLWNYALKISRHENNVQKFHFVSCEMITNNVQKLLGLWLCIFNSATASPLHGFMVFMVYDLVNAGRTSRQQGQRGQSVNITTWVKYNGDSINIANFSYWNFHARCFANLETLQEHNITLRFTAQPIDE